MASKDNGYIEKPHIIEFNNMVRELGQFQISKEDPNALDLVKAHCDEYRKLCTAYGITPTWEGLCLALGKNRYVVTQWREGAIQWAKDAGITEYLQGEFAWLNSVLVTSMIDGRTDKITGIFYARNNYGYLNEDQAPKKTEVNVHLSMEQLIEGAKNLQLETDAEKRLLPIGDKKTMRLKNQGMLEKEPEHKTRKPKAQQLNEIV